MVDTRYKTFWRRFGALVVDGLVFLSLTLATPDVQVGSSMWTVSMATLGAGVPIVYSTVMHARAGQTIGKMATRVIVLDVSETHIPGWRQAARRDVLNYSFLAASFVLSSMLASMTTEGERVGVVSFGLGLLFASLALTFAEVVSTLTNPRRRSVHDRIAGTVVVKTGSLSETELVNVRRRGPTNGVSSSIGGKRAGKPGTGW